MSYLSQLLAQHRVRGPVRSLARGAAVQRDLASRALLGPLVAFVIGTRLARRVVESSGFFLRHLVQLSAVHLEFLGSSSSMLRKDKNKKMASFQESLAK